MWILVSGFGKGKGTLTTRRLTKDTLCRRTKCVSAMMRRYLDLTKHLPAPFVAVQLSESTVEQNQTPKTLCVPHGAIGSGPGSFHSLLIWVNL